MEWSTGHGDYQLVEDSGSFETAEFDRCIIDLAAFRAHWEALREHKRAVEPVLIPYLLLVPDPEGGFIGRDEADPGGDITEETIDEVVSLPLQMEELEWRVRALLRLRRQSLALHDREVTVRETAQRLRATIQASPNAIIVVDPEGRVEQWNPAAERIFGWTRDEVLGEPNPIIPEDKQAEFDRWVTDILDGDAQTGLETQRRAKDGSLLDVRLSTAPIRDASDEAVGAMAVIEDVSDRVDRERALRRFRQAITATSHAVYITDTEGMIKYVNPAFETITGYPRTEAIGQTPRILSTGELVQLIERVADQVAGEFPSSSIDLSLPDTATVDVSTNFALAVEELLVNAIEHNDQDNPEVHVSLESTPGRLCLRIGDNGPGIPDMDRSVVAGDREIEPLYHGSGLGLWLVSWVVRRSEGTLSFGENDPQGSVVTIQLSQQVDGSADGAGERS